MKSTIRPMLLTDLDRVGALSKELGYHNSNNDLISRFREIMTVPSHSLLVIDDGEVQGWIHLEVVTSLHQEKKLEIKALVVDQTKRSSGFGKQLLDSAREWAKIHRLGTIYLSCNIIRDRAHAFYLREGFKKVKTSHFFEMKI